MDAELAEHQALLERAERQIARLVQTLADGGNSEYIRAALQALEATAKSEKATVAALTVTKGKPVVIPSPDVISEKYNALEVLMREEPLRARGVLKDLFEDGQLKVVPEGERLRR